MLIFLFLVSCQEPRKIEVPENLGDYSELTILSSSLVKPELRLHLSSISEEYSSFKIDFSIPKDRDTSTAVQHAFSSDRGPGIFTHWPDSVVRRLYDSQHLATLNDFREIYSDIYSQEGIDLLIHLLYEEDRLYGIPLEMTIQSLWVNESLMSQYEWEIPQSYEELLNIVKKAGQRNIISFSISSMEELSYLYQFLVVMNSPGQEYQNPKGKGRKAYITALKQIDDLYNLNAFPPNLIENLYHSYKTNHFEQGNALFQVQGSWCLGKFSDTAYSWSMYPFPAKNIQEKPFIFIGLGSNTLYVNKKYQEELHPGTAVYKTIDTIIEMARPQIGIPEELQHLYKTYRTAQPADYYLEPIAYYNLLCRIPLLLDGYLSSDELWEKYICSLEE